MNEVENVRYVHSDRSWMAALLGLLAGFVLGATFMGVVSLMMWTMRTQRPSAPSTADAASQAATGEVLRHDSVQAEGMTAEPPVNGDQTVSQPQRTTSRFEARPKNDEAEPSEITTDVVTSDEAATPEMPEHGPMSKATIEAYRLPGAEPE